MAGEVPSGWTTDEKGRLRRETIHHMGRLPGWDYRRKGYYVITIVLADRREGKLGRLVVRNPAACAAGAGWTGGTPLEMGWTSGWTMPRLRR